MADMTTHETTELISAGKVEGTPVYNRAGEKLGTVEDIMLHKQSGKVAYAILSFGGFLGLGEQCHPLPWSVLDYDESRHGYVVDLDKEMLKNAPQCQADARTALRDAALHQEIYTYYGVSPLW